MSEQEQKPKQETKGCSCGNCGQFGLPYFPNNVPAKKTNYPRNQVQAICDSDNENTRCPYFSFERYGQSARFESLRYSG